MTITCQMHGKLVVFCGIDLTPFNMFSERPKVDQEFGMPNLHIFLFLDHSFGASNFISVGDQLALWYSNQYLLYI